MPHHTPSALRVILLAGAVAGTLDISDALIFSALHGVQPSLVLQFITSGLLGASSFRGGMSTAALGLLLHFFIAFTVTIIYYLASRRVEVLNRRPIVFGLLYGAMVYLVMNTVVLPLSSVPSRRMTTASLINGVLAVMLLVGLPVAYIVSRFSRKEEGHAQP